MRVLTHKSNAMNFFRLIENALIASVGGFRPILRGFANGVQDDDLATVAQVNSTVAPIPFSFSAVLALDLGGIAIGLTAVLPGSDTIPAEAIGTGPEQVSGCNLYLDIQRGSYWGDIAISVEASPIFDVDVQLTPIDNTQCNSLVTAVFNDSVVAGEAYTISITATGGGYSITRTFTLNIAEE